MNTNAPRFSPHFWADRHPGQILDPEQPEQLPESLEWIRLQDVHFHYKTGQPVIRGLAAGCSGWTTLGLPGQPVEARCTLIKLLFGSTMSPAVVFWKGADIRQVRVEDLRRQIALVSQDVYLFHGTIRENIALWAKRLPDGASSKRKKA